MTSEVGFFVDHDAHTAIDTDRRSLGVMVHARGLIAYVIASLCTPILDVLIKTDAIPAALIPISTCAKLRRSAYLGGQPGCNQQAKYESGQSLHGKTPYPTYRRTGH